MSATVFDPKVCRYCEQDICLLHGIQVALRRFKFILLLTSYLNLVSICCARHEQTRFPLRNPEFPSPDKTANSLNDECRGPAPLCEALGRIFFKCVRPFRTIRSLN